MEQLASSKTEKICYKVFKVTLFNLHFFFIKENRTLARSEKSMSCMH
jgi:hypothetical protein